MSQHFIHIPGLVKPEDLSAIDSLLNKASFVDGKITASLAAKTVKHNLQVDANHREVLDAIHSFLGQALQNSQLFQATALPYQVYPFLVSKYGPGQYYGWHVDSPVMGSPPVRTDLAMTIFLSDPDSYTGGELLLQTEAGIINLKPRKGDAIMYPCQYLHCVNEVKSGERLAAVTWIQSMVRSPAHRKILFEMSQVHAALLQKDIQSPEANQLLQTYSNLLRMWAEV